MKNYFIGFPTWKDTRFFFFRVLVLVGDLLAVSVAYFVGFYVRFYYPTFLASFPVTKGIPSLAVYFQAAPIILFMWVLALSWRGTYRRINMPAMDEAIRIVGGSVLGTLLAMSALFLYRDISYSRLVFVLGGFLSCLLVYGWREALKITYLYWIRRNRRPRRVLVLGNGYLSLSIQRILKSHEDRAILKQSHSNMELVKRAIVRSRISEVLVANPKIEHEDVIRLADFCEERRVEFRILPNVMELRMGEVLIDESLGLPTIKLKPGSLHGSSFVAKRAMDVVLASFIIGILFIPLVTICLLIKITSPGPIFYKHKRVGYHGREFDFMKFRTMVSNADDLLEKLRERSDRKGPVFKMKSDPRITLIGKFLRRYSVDEVPQLWNVLRGEMSLVGPRPQVIWEAAQYNEWAKKRLNVLPGITGLWQVSGRAELTYQEMIDLDVYYIEHWSPGLDLRILARTLPAVLFGKGAY